MSVYMAGLGNEKIASYRFCKDIPWRVLGEISDDLGLVISLFDLIVRGDFIGDNLGIDFVAGLDAHEITVQVDIGSDGLELGGRHPQKRHLPTRNATCQPETPPANTAPSGEPGSAREVNAWVRFG